MPSVEGQWYRGIGFRVPEVPRTRSNAESKIKLAVKAKGTEKFSKVCWLLMSCWYHAYLKVY